jgi:glucokinase
MAAQHESLPAHGDACLVADIGGTNARFALAHGGSAAQLDLSHAQTRRVGDFETLGAALNDYLRELPLPQRPRRAVLAVASPVHGDRIAFTNSRWNFSVEALQRELGLHSLRVMNDFAAVAWALPALRDVDVVAVGTLASNAARGDGVRVVVGPGTGLGVAATRTASGVALVLESEGGHAGFAPRDDDEMHLLRFLRARHGRVSVERLLSGEGLLALYQAWCLREDAPATLRRAEDVSRAAQEGHALARAATRSFCTVLGSFAGDVALMFCAWEGVYLAGAMLRHVLDDEGARAFRAGFEDKGRFAARLRAIPTLRIARDDVGHLGAALYGLQPAPALR